MQTIADLPQSEQLFVNDAGFVQLDNVGLLITSGADCKKHLHSFCTNEILKTVDGDAVEAFVLDVKGKTIGHIHALIREDAILQIAINGQNEVLHNHLDRYVIREEVEFEDQTSDYLFFWLDGPKAAAFVGQFTGGAAPANKKHVITSINGIETTIAKLPLYSESGYLLYCECGKAQTVVEALVQAKINQCDAHALELLRIKSGIPAFGSEVTTDRLPQELCRDEQAISFVKGCYLGQETVARIDALGQVNWLLAKLETHGEVDDMPGTLFMSDEKQIGKISSIAYSPAADKTYALAFLRRGNEASGNQLESGKFQWTVIE